MPKCPHNPKLRCKDPSKCYKCAELRKTGQQLLGLTKTDIAYEAKLDKEREKKQLKAGAEYYVANMEIKYACPFCLHIAQLKEYLISTKKGIHQGLGECPECHCKMQFKSLKAEWTPEQYAEWVFEYAARGFWQKIPWATWKRRLEELGWAQRFWDKYKQLKGENPSEGAYPEDSQEQYDEFMRRHGKEE